MSCSRITNDYDGITHDYTRKQGLVYEKIYLPDRAPKEWNNRAALWNAVEEAEKSKNSRLARELIIALPIEFAPEVWVDMLDSYVDHFFVKRGMCADVCIHDTDGHNPHAHILLTVRPLTQNGIWQKKTQKEYLCVRNGEEKGFTSYEYKAAQADGWEKQYLYKVGRRKRYLPPSEAEGLERVSKYPKSSRYGRQNPIMEDWNSEKTLLKWRKAWADQVNFFYDLAEKRQRISALSYSARGIKKQPTVHVGPIGWALVIKGLSATNYELNRMIGLDNELIDDLVDTIETLTKTIFLALSKIVDAIIIAKSDLYVMQYCSHVYDGAGESVAQQINNIDYALKEYHDVNDVIKQKIQEKSDAQARVKKLFVSKTEKSKLLCKINTLTIEIDKLEKRSKRLLDNINCVSSDDIPKAEEQREKIKPRLEMFETKHKEYKDKLEKALDDYETLKRKTDDYDSAEVEQAYENVPYSPEDKAWKTIKDKFEQPNIDVFWNCVDNIDKRVGEWVAPEPIEKTQKPAIVNHNERTRKSKPKSRDDDAR